MAKSSNKSASLKSVLSFRPFLMILKKMIAEDKPGARSLYGELVESLEDNPEILKPIKDESFLRKNQKIIDTLCTTIFPPSITRNETPYAVTYPFGLQTIHASNSFKELFINGSGNFIEIPSDNTNEKIKESGISLAYNLILNEFYSISAPDYETFIFSFNAPENVLKKMEMKLDARFMSVAKAEPDFVLPEKTSAFHSLNIEEMEKVLPLNNFLFEGVTIVDIIDVTEREIISEIKTDLIAINSFSDASVYENLQLHIESLIGLKNISIGLTPFFKASDFYLFSEVHIKNSLLFKDPETINQKDQVIHIFQDLFKSSSDPLIFEKMDEKNVTENPYLKYYAEQGFRSLIIYPIKNDISLLGLLEIAAKEPLLKPGYLAMIDQIIPLFTLALEKGQENLEAEIDRKIKENFTAIQSAVEWKFTEVAFNYIQEKQVNENAKLPIITFDNVYPLFGAVDIRNSSGERAKAMQEDLITQLKLVKEVGEEIKNAGEFPLLREMLFKADGYLQLDRDKWMAEDDMTVHAFLQEDIYTLFSHLKHNMPDIAEKIDEYFKALNPDRKMVYDASKRYEESIAEINEILSYFVDHDQASAQKIFPHYFERYISDGIEFNIYIGQSIAPNMKFDEVYVRNLRMWQLELLAKSARLTHQLEKKLPLFMQTTQLILVHSLPISISFRNKERKFDVDGAYNIRYEVIKKRIDKVCIKDTDQRLTQPGKLAIVYSQAKDAAEYREYIQFLQNQKLLEGEVEEFELEELQGVSGLKALRVDVTFDN